MIERKRSVWVSRGMQLVLYFFVLYFIIYYILYFVNVFHIQGFTYCSTICRFPTIVVAILIKNYYAFVKIYMYL